MLINFPTLLIALLAESLTLLVATGLLARCGNGDRHGMYWLAGALGLLSLAFILAALHNTLPYALSIGVANIGISASFVLLGKAVRQFCKAGLGGCACLRMFPPILATAGVLFAGSHLATFSLLFNAVLIGQELHLVYTLSRTDSPLYRGRYMISSGLLLNAVTLAALLFTPHDEGHPTTLQGLLFLTCFPTQVLVVLGYILMEKDAEEVTLKQLAMKDNLTQCWNRNYLEPAAAREMQRMHRHGIPVSLVILDIDLFKNVNDHFGHTTGDEMLRGFADTASSCIRSTDSIIRWGGEEFVLLLPATGYSAAACLAERIRCEFSARTFPGGAQATVSAGYASFQRCDTWQDWFGRADSALYHAKSLGRNRVEPPAPEAALNHPEMFLNVAWD